MANTLFIQSEEENPFDIYNKMIKEQPFYWDKKNKIWVIYSYNICDFVINNESFEIPKMQILAKGILNKYAEKILANLVRISNPPKHNINKEVTINLVRSMKYVSTNILLDDLLNGEDLNNLDWVHTIAKKLPLYALLKYFQFKDADIEFISKNILKIKLLMVNPKSNTQINNINEVVEKTFKIVENLIKNLHYNLVDEHYKRLSTSKEKLLEAYVSNMIGLFLQSYDAGRGLISNTLFNYIKYKTNYLNKLVTETLRFNPVFHNTKRILTKDLRIDNYHLKKGQNILVVLAAANRDPSIFEEPNIFKLDRENNTKHLSFSNGIHFCPADHFSIKLATDVLKYITAKYKFITLLDENIEYEPMVNARIPKQILIKLSN